MATMTTTTSRTARPHSSSISTTNSAYRTISRPPITQTYSNRSSPHRISTLDTIPSSTYAELEGNRRDDDSLPSRMLIATFKCIGKILTFCCVLDGDDSAARRRKNKQEAMREISRTVSENKNVPYRRPSARPVSGTYIANGNRRVEAVLDLSRGAVPTKGTAY